MDRLRAVLQSELAWRGLEPSNLLAICSCGHVKDHDPVLVESRRRYLEAEMQADLDIVVAHLAEKALGWAQTVPIETAARDIEGERAVFLHCVNVSEQGRGVGRALLGEVLRRAERQGRGVVVDACADVWGFMPEQFFSRLGFSVAQARGRRRLMYTGLPAGAHPPRYLAPWYDPPHPTREQDKAEVIVDVFFTPLCGGSISEEAAVMRQAAEVHGDRVLVREWNAGNPEVRRRFGIARAVFVNGVMRPNGDTIRLEEASGLITDALSKPAPSHAVWDDSISRLF
ncbi:TPA: hypothetical protein DCY65_00465 [Candidatus Acetothermia bacterium]|nr:hypothetical protein [Candidatus Acetothermia bacterium]